MKALITLLILFNCHVVLFAQTEIKYVNFKFELVPFEKAEYKMVITKLNDTLFKDLFSLNNYTLDYKLKHHINTPENVFCEKLYSKSLVECSGWLFNNIKTGDWRYFNNYGKIRSVKTFENDKEIYFKIYSVDGNLKKEVPIKDNNYHGLCKYYSKKGEIISQGNFINGKLDESFVQSSIVDSTKNDSTKKILITARLPEFPGGETAMMQFIRENTFYPEEAQRKGIEGSVRVKFTVRHDGLTSEVKVISKDILGYGCERAAMEVVDSMPEWSPGILNDVPVKVYFNVPISFRLF